MSATFLRLMEGGPGRYRTRRLVNLDLVSDASYFPAGTGEDEDTDEPRHFVPTLYLRIGWGEGFEMVTLNGDQAAAAARALGLVDPPAGGEKCVTASVVSEDDFHNTYWAFGPDGRIELGEDE